MASKDKILAYIDEHKRMLRKVYHGLDYFCFSGISSDLFRKLFRQSLKLREQQSIVTDEHAVIMEASIEEIVSKVPAGYLTSAARDKIKVDIAANAKERMVKMNFDYFERVFFNLLWLFYKYELEQKEIDNIQDTGSDIPNLSNLLPLSHLRKVFDKIDHDL